MQPLNGNELTAIYTSLNIHLDKAGCVMLDVDGSIIPEFKNTENLYVSPDPTKFWIKGFVAAKTPHVTLLYGLLQAGTAWKKYIDVVLQGWNLPGVTITEVGFFDSPYPNEPYYCIVAHLEISPELQAMHDRLQLLPHVDTNPGYKAHITIAYIKKDPNVRDDVIDYYTSQLAGKTLKVLQLNYGGKPSVAKKMYCVSCRESKEPKNVESITLANGRPAQRGKCPRCSTMMHRLGKGE